MTNPKTGLPIIPTSELVEYLIKGFAETEMYDGVDHARNSVYYKEEARRIIEERHLTVTVLDLQSLGIKHAEAYKKYRRAVAKSVKEVMAKQ